VWRAKTARALLALKVVDPAMGSGAFLVSACRYLADRLVDAWDRDGVPDDDAELLDAVGDRDELLLVARRRVAARCLYGVDRDDMAVELAKLSLWLVILPRTNRSASSIMRCAAVTRWSAWYPSTRWPRSISTSTVAGPWAPTCSAP
jgi:hypothetical protein